MDKVKIPSTYGIAVDWVTGNIYYNKARTRIGIVSFDRKIQATIYDTQEKTNIISIAVDPVAGCVHMDLMNRN